MRKIKILHVVGARPQFVKMAPVAEAAKSFGCLETVIVHTGQHYDGNMSDIFFSQLRMPRPKYNLGIGSGSYTAQIAGMIEGLGRILVKESPDVVFVYGDTNSTLAGAVAATKSGIKLAHVEAGLRSFNRSMPEETNRIMTDSVSDILFCPTETAVKNLRGEGMRKGIFQVEDVMLDMLVRYSGIARRSSNILADLGRGRGDYYLTTVHRSYNTDDLVRLRSLIEVFGSLGKPVVFPVHPRTKKEIVENVIKASSNIIMIDPVSYIDMLMLEMNAAAILTDSGGVQKEAFFFRVPCVTLREETEWVETVKSGWNIMTGVDECRIRKALRHFLSEKFARRDRKPPYGNMSSAKKMLKITIAYLKGER